MSTEVVRQLLDNFDFSKRKAQKSIALGAHPDRNEQFEYISELKEEYLRTTCTRTGLRVTLNVLEREYHTKRKATWDFLEAYPILFDEYLTELNYTFAPPARRAAKRRQQVVQTAVAASRLYP